ncbi:tetratricopeptide repeat protein [Ferrovibrio sp. MS7]|uniref:O-linked N-acetylglucosamine transferase, SPINDLY family protein n=1 Tax=Ferrovibrio plantarum TaxID=3119164 RepID=UPI0031376765
MAKAAAGGVVTAQAVVEAAVAAFQRGAYEETEKLCRVLLNAAPNDPAALQLLGLAAFRRGQLIDAEATLAKAAANAKTSPEIQANHAAVLRALGRLKDAEAANRRAIALKEDFPEGHQNLGNTLRDLGRHAEAEVAFRRAVELKPNFSDAWLSLGRLLQLVGRLADSEVAFRKVIELKPDFADVHSDLGNSLMGLDRLTEAEASFRQALALKPNSHEASVNLAALLLRAGRPNDAEIFARRALALKPDLHQGFNNLAIALEDQGRLDEASGVFRQVLKLKPDYASGHSSLLFCLNYRHDLSAEEIAEEYRTWDKTHARPLLPRPLRHANSPEAGRKLKIGYVSPDFRQHAVALFFEPVLEAHDREQVEIYLYGEVSNPDAVTQRLKSKADHWRSTVGLSDDRMAALIRQDGIDVLIDLAGHTAGNRLLVFARKPAPVQFSYLIGHGTTTGLSAIDGFISDDFMVPEGFEHLFSEKIIRIPRSPLVYRPPEHMPDVGPLPAKQCGKLRFGCFSRTVRINEDVIAIWAELLNRIPDATLVLNSKPFAEKFTRQMFEERFATHGIGPERLELIYTQPQPKTWAHYNEIDIALDPFPHNAGTTTIEALWMGVPVLSLAARPSVGRFGASILGALGMSDWVAADPDEYLDIAERWAKDIDGLAKLRAGLRDRFEASAMRDAPGLARAIETAYRQLWNDWCESRALAGTEPPEAERPLTYSDVVAAFNVGDREQARRICAALLEQQPDNADALQAMGVLCCDVKDYPAAMKWLSRAVAINPNLPEYWSSLGVVARAMKLHGDAENFYRKAIALRPIFAEAYNNLGNALRDQGKLVEAEEALRKAIEQKPDFEDAMVNLGLVLLARERFDDAEVVLRKVLALKPERPDIHDALAIMLMRRGRLSEAEEFARSSLRLRPDHPATLGTLGVVLEDQARHDEALAALRRAVTIAPGDLAVSSSLLFCQNYRPGATAEEIFEEYKRWDDRHGKPHLPNPLRHDNDPNPNRKLKIGYVSPDLRQHVVSLFFEPVLSVHDRGKFEIFLYGEVPNPDAMTTRFQKMADHWRSTVGKSDDEVANMIRADGIDILIDLAGHTAGNRLTMFARKPAPVQFTYLIGHGTTTGLSAIDGFLVDAAMVPEGYDHLFAEKVVRLPRSPLCYMAPPAMPLVAPLPALKKGKKKKPVVTFGCFSRTVRMNDEVIEVWSRILNEIPNARLVLNSKPFTDEPTRKLFLDRFAAHGVEPERLDLIFTNPQPRTWDYYGNIDIALDPFPHNAGTTTIEALWMGVPVLSLAGRPSVGRFGASILGALGMDDWVAQNHDEYVAIAKKWANDLPALAELRRNLRGTFEKSPMRDGVSLTRAIEQAYIQFWHDWCASQGAKSAVPAVAKPAATPAQEAAAKAQALLDAAIRAFQSGQLPQAEQAAVALLALAPKNADALHILGLIAYRRRDWQKAADLIGEAVKQLPDMAELRWNRAGALRQLGRLKEAEAECRKAVALKPDSAEARNNLANTLKDLGKLDESEQEFREAVRLRPNYPHGWANLGNTLFAMGRFVEAEEACRKSIALEARNPDAHNNLGNALLGQERLDEAAESFRAALAINPDYVLSHSNLLFCSNYRADLTAEEIYAEYRRWDERFGKPKLPNPLQHANAREPERRLKVGYVSPDFRNHAVAMFFEPLLASRDKAAFEIYLYGEVPTPDAITERLKSQADHWRGTVGKGDDDVAAMIRADGIDILVDLAGHTAGNRLGVFTRKPAPVQFSYLIGQGYTTGLSAVDGFFSDDYMVPQGFEHLFSERIVRLGRSPLVYRPPEAMPEVGPLPALRNGHVTFGSFSRTVRLNEKVIALWSRLLKRVPDSRLVLNSKPFAEAATRDLFQQRFDAHGITPERLELIYTFPQTKTWAHYNEIDIALDPFPHNAGTTTIEALWMGVPVLSKADRPSVGRFGASILGALEMQDWVTEDEAAYIEIGARWAGNLEALAQLRAGLRPRFEASPMRDGPGLAKAIEAGYRQLWREWCGG